MLAGYLILMVCCLSWFWNPCYLEKIQQRPGLQLPCPLGSWPKVRALVEMSSIVRGSLSTTFFVTYYGTNVA